MLRISHGFLFIGLVAIGLAGAADSPALAGSSKKSAQAPKVDPTTYVAFRDQIAEISKLRLDDPKNVDRAKQMLLAHDERGLSQGFVAQCSKVAANDEKFSAGVKKAARKRGAESLMAKLQSDPSAVLDISGWQSASQGVLKTVAQDAAAMQSLSHRLSEIAYGRTSNEAQLARQAQAGAGVTGASEVSRRASKSASPLMTQILALGAMMALSQTGQAPVPSSAAMLVANKENDQCLRWSDLNLKQCLAAARDNQERAYCLSEEAISSRSDCWSKVMQSGT